MIPDWISHETRLGRALRWPLRWVPPESPRRIRWGPTAGCSWYPGSGPASIWLGLYERRTQKAFGDRVRGVVWDIGAHAGLYSMIAAARGADVYAFEPLAENRRWMERNLQVNGLHVRVAILPYALGDRAGTAHFQPDPTGMEGRLTSIGELAVEVRRGAELELPPPQVLKIDVEGAEAAVLRGLLPILREWRPVVFLEEHGDASESRALLTDHDYSSKRIEPRRYVWTHSNGVESRPSPAAAAPAAPEPAP